MLESGKKIQPSHPGAHIKVTPPAKGGPVPLREESPLSGFCGFHRTTGMTLNMCKVTSVSVLHPENTARTPVGKAMGQLPKQKSVYDVSLTGSSNPAAASRPLHTRALCPRGACREGWLPAGKTRGGVPQSSPLGTRCILCASMSLLSLAHSMHLLIFLIFLGAERKGSSRGHDPASQMPTVRGTDMLWKCHSVLVQKGAVNWGKDKLRWGEKSAVFWSEGGNKIIPTRNFSAQLTPDRMSPGAAEDLKKAAGNPVCRTGKLKSFLVMSRAQPEHMK